MTKCSDLKECSSCMQVWIVLSEEGDYLYTASTMVKAQKWIDSLDIGQRDFLEPATMILVDVDGDGQPIDRVEL